MSASRWWHVAELRWYLRAQAKILKDGGTPPVWLTAKIAALQAET